MNARIADTNGKTVISTFAGCGGSSLGYKWAGFQELLAIDFEQNAVDTFALNFPEVPVWKRDITTVKGSEILEFCNIKKGELGIFDGSPPCQGFSTAGKRQVTDSRNDLFKDFVRLIIELQPKVFVMENVSGMIKGKFRGKFNEIMQTLKDTGYRVKCKLMNAMWYEVPQSRERLIFIGIRNDLNIEPSFPEPLNEVITAGEICNDIDGESIEKYAIYQKLCKLKEGEKSLKYLNLIKQRKDKPLAALTKTAGICGAASVCKWNNKKFAVHELLQLCSFPNDFKLTGTYTEKVNRLGNAVMPKMMYHIANHINKTVFNNGL